MNVFELAAKLTLDTSAFDKGLSAVGGTIKKAGKTIGIALGAATTAVVALTKSAVSAYADYEQLVGGVETLFGNGGKNIRQLAKETGKSVRDIAKEYSSHERAQKRMLENADNAYKSAGLSANQYMETATSFAASLISSLGGDTEKAVDYTNRAVVQMADNANKMGTDIGAIQAAYQGFAKQNYTMLDNLKLGYGGTKTEMERLITDAEALDSSFKATRDSNGKLTMSYAEIVDAIQIVQDNMGITGTTAAEAEKTISGSVSMMKASWENLLTAMASGNGFKEQMDALVSSASTALNNILPVVENFLVGFGDLMKQVGPIIVEKLPEIIEEVVPSMLDAAVQIVGALVEALPGILQAIVTVFGSLVDSISSYLNERWPEVGATFDSIVEFAKTAFNGIISFLKKVFSGDWKGAWNDLKTAVKKIKWAEIGEKVKTAVGAAWSTLREWAGKLWEKAKTGIQSVNWAEVGGKVKDAISGAWNALKSWAKGLWKSAKAGIESVDWGAAGTKVLQWIGASWSQLKSWAQGLWEKARDGIAAVDWKSVGSAIWKTIKEGIGSLVDNMKTLFETGTDGIKNVDWKTLGSDIWDLIKSGLETLGSGFLSLFSSAKDDVENGDSIDWAGLGKSILEFIFEGMKGIGNLILGLFQAAWEDIQNIPWADLGLVIANWILDGMGGLGDWIRDKLDIARVSIEDLDWSGTGKEAASQVVDGMSGLPDDVSGIGERSAKAFGGGGVGRGTRNIWLQTAEQVAEKLTNGISVIEKNVTSVADSSARGFEAARWSTHGSEAGLKVANAFKKTAEKALDAITQIQNAINGITGKAVTVQINKTTYETTVSKGAKTKTTSYSLNARAMDTGYIFRHPKVFAYADNAFQVAGDVGAEAVVGVHSLDNMIQNSVNAAVGRTQAAMVGVLSEILDKMPKGQLVLDTGALVGGIAPEMNDELERITAWSGGGRA